MKTVVLFAVALALSAGISAAQERAAQKTPANAGIANENAVGFDSPRWVKVNGQAADHLGRKSLMGNAYLPDAAFENGVIEVDIAVTGDRSYPGIAFRAFTQQDYEQVYIRPHRGGLYPDAVQYAPKVKGIASWQLCNGPGSTAMAEFPEGEWMHFRLEVKGTQARLFIDDMANPVLVIDRLQNGVKKGGIGVEGPADGSAYFSNFRYETRDDLVFDPPANIDTPPGTITEWELSPSKKLSDTETEKYPGSEELGKIAWQKVQSDPDGIVNAARYAARSGREPDCVIARTTIRSEKPQTSKYLIGYSDVVSVFLNGKILFEGQSAYQQRDPSFLGIIGLWDALYLPLEKGDNELLLIVTEAFGGWGFVCRDAGAVFTDASVTKSWETGADFLFPESAVYDAKRGVVYVSNFDVYGRAGGGQFVSKMTLDGKIVEREAIKGLARPTGMVIAGDRLFVVERNVLVEIDLETGEAAGRHPLPPGGLPNDVAIDSAGNLYVSDSGKSVIYRRAFGGEFEEWLAAPVISQPNGLLVEGGRLLVGCTGDNALKSVDLATKMMTVVARFEPGAIDGIKAGHDGDLFVSHAEGRIYRVSADGKVTRIVDTSGPGQYTADFDYIPEKNLLVVPTYVDNRVVAYRVK
jgi:sugar lactone lactonase YvrE